MNNRDQVRSDVASIIIRISERMTSSHLAVRLGVDPPKVAALRNRRLEIFSIERLMHLATRLGHDVDITIRPHARPGFRYSHKGVVRVVDQSDSRAL